MQENSVDAMKRRLHGSLDSALRGFLLVLQRCCPGLHIVRIYRAPLKRGSGPPPSGVSVKLATAEDLQPFFDQPGFELTRGFVQEAFERGDACVTTWLNDTLAAYGWVAYRGAAPHVDGLQVRFQNGYRYNYKNLTLPEFRGRHLRGSFGVLRELDEAHGVTHTLAFIAVDNVASIRAEQRSGGVVVGYAGYLRLLRRYFVFRSRGAARYGFAFKAPV